MPTDLEDLVAFLHHGNTQIRQTATGSLLGYSISHQSIFKANHLEPIKDLKLLVKDYTPISKNALTLLINLSEDQEILKNLSSDDAFIESLLLRITRAKEPNADEISMLLANMAKADEIIGLLKVKRAIPKPLSTSPFAIDQLMDCFVKGAEGSYNKHANYDYLSYFFADLAKHPESRSYFVTPNSHDDNIIPLTKIVVFTEHPSHIRRLGVASTMKNVSFDIESHPQLLAPHYVASKKPETLLTITAAGAEEQSSKDPDHINILPYLFLPLCGPEDFPDQDQEGMLEDLQLLPPDKKREPDHEILKTHLETLLLLTTTREGRETLRRIKTYAVVRELHANVEDEGVREGADRLVQVIARDEHDGEEVDQVAQPVVAEAMVEEVDSDDEVVEVM